MFFSHSDIRNLRKKAGLTQSELAELAGVSQSLIAKIEMGCVDPRLSTYKKILTILYERLGKMNITVNNILSMKKQQSLYKLIFLKPDNTIDNAILLMKKYGIDHIPIFSNGNLVGSVTKDLLLERLLFALNMNENKDNFIKTKLSEVMSDCFPLIEANAPIGDLYSLFKKGHSAVLITNNNRIVGLLTKSDLLNLLILVNTK